MITLVRPGKDLSRVVTCPHCGCEFSFLPGDVVNDATLIYNVPPEFRKEYGGEYGPCEVRFERVVPCPGCKMKVSVL